MRVRAAAGWGVRSWACSAISVTNCGVLVPDPTRYLLRKIAHRSKARGPQRDADSSARVHDVEAVAQLQQLHVGWDGQPGLDQPLCLLQPKWRLTLLCMGGYCIRLGVQLDERCVDCIKIGQSVRSLLCNCTHVA